MLDGLITCIIAYLSCVRLMTVATGWLPRLPRLHSALPVHARQDGRQSVRHVEQVQPAAAVGPAARHEPARPPAQGQLALPPGTSHVHTHPLRANSHFLQVFVPATSTVTQTHTVVIYCVIVTRDQRDQRSPEKRALMTS